MHRLIAPAVAALAVAIAAPAFAKTDITVTIGPALQKKAETYGQRELDDLTKWLADSVRSAYARNDNGPDRVNLVIEDVKPNRPTAGQWGSRLGLSMRSIALGGASVTGTVVTGGRSTPISYSWYETDIHNEIGATTWSDADKAFMYLSNQLRRGELPNTPVRVARQDGTDFGSFR